MRQHLRPALACIVLFTLLLGLVYPLAVTGVAQLAMPAQADGSLIVRDGRVVGSALVGQSFTRPEYLRPRPSAAGADGYDAAASSGSNYGPLNPDLIAAVGERAAAIRSEAPGIASGVRIPADAVTASGSGLDPDISPASAALQAPRIAAARGAPPAEVRRIIAAHTAQPLLGFIGQPRVNVLETNLALDARLPVRQRAADADASGRAATS
jgi:K+-transporting ATPase ATPase C chain